MHVIQRWRVLATLGAAVAAPAAVGGCRSSEAATAEGDRPPAAATPARVAGTRPAARDRLWLEMRNVDLHVGERAAIRVRRLRGEMVSARSDSPPVLDDTKSFTVRVTSGTVSLSGEALGALLNDRVFAYRGSPLKRLEVKTSGSQVVLRGVMHKGVDIPFETWSSLSLEPDGRVRLRPTRSRILGLNGLKLLGALHTRLDKLLDLRGARGVTAKGNDLYLEPTRILPPPAIEGRLASIAVEGPDVVQTFVTLPDDSVFARSVRPDSEATNELYFRGGQLRFGKLLMTDTDLQIVDADPRDPFDLYLDRYQRQLVAGTSRTLETQGLRVVMPDYRAVAGAATAHVVTGVGAAP